ncbi:MAG: hypothetical protein OXG44_06425 [Gammaproteobacteria bacterium]|nr:hypothetical protein [Gammaproteobacteria bacterium]
MAVTLTVGDLAVALRVVDDGLTATQEARLAVLEAIQSPSDAEAAELAELERIAALLSASERAIITRHLATATAAVLRHAPDAPNAIHDEAAARFAGWLFDAPAAEQRSGRDGLVRSGAAALLLPYRRQRLVGATGAAAAAPTGSQGPAVDQTARTAAAAADAKAVAAQVAAGRAQAAADAAGVAAVAARGVADAALPANAPALARIPSAPGSVNGKVWKTGPAGEAPDWRDDATLAGDGAHNDATARAAAAAADAKAVAAQAEADANDTRLDNLDNRLTDLHAGPTPTGWADAGSDNQGGIAVLNALPTLATARGISTFARTLSSGLGSKWPVVRIPAATDARQARVRLTSVAPVTTYDQPLTGWTRLGLTADDAWQLYADTGNPLGSGVASVKLQLTGSAAHVGQSVFSGLLGAGIVKLAALATAVAERLLPTGGGNGKFLGYASDAPAWVDAPGGGTPTLKRWNPGAVTFDNTWKDTGLTLAVGAVYIAQSNQPGFAGYADELGSYALLPVGTIGGSEGTASNQLARTSDGKLLYGRAASGNITVDLRLLVWSA